MSRRPRVLFVHNVRASFVRLDLALLHDAFDVEEVYARAYFDPPPWSLIAAVTRADVVYCWFASWHAVVPVVAARVLRRRAIVVTGGYDVAAVPEIGYGLQRGGLGRVLSRLVLRSAVRVLPFSHAAAAETIRNGGAPKASVEVVPLGVPVPTVAPAPRERMVMTVATIDRASAVRKGLSLYADTAALVPDITFLVVGAIADPAIAAELRSRAPNIRLVGTLTDTALAATYARAAAYLQLSVHEGFGMAVAEAMSAGCIPIVTRTGSLPEVAGEAGIYVADAAGAAAAVRSSLDAPEAQRRSVAARIRDRFSLDARREALTRIVRGAGSRFADA